ncbi:MAG: hypothetical protein KBF26_13755, partial [Opitutaceae bacterium]|nr:hypothetical protein [Opitutaceae bacterium]
MLPGVIHAAKSSYRSMRTGLALFLVAVGGRSAAQVTFTWSSSTPPVTSVIFGDILDITTVANHDFNATALSNSGTVNWQAGQLRSGSAGSITNHNVWNDTASNALNNDFGGTAWSFINTATGTYHKAGSGTTNFGVPFQNDGTVSATAGTLTIAAGGSSTGGTFTAAAGAVVDFTSNYTLAGAITFGGAGMVQLSAGTLGGTATLSGPLTWTAGSIAGLTFGPASVLTISSGANHDFNASAWINHGTVDWTGGQLRSGSSGSITNHATWNDTASNSLNNAYGGAAWTFTNTATGTYFKAGPGTTTVSVPFFNQGAINATAGSLAIAAGGTSTGGQFITANGANIDFTGGYHLVGTVTFSGTGTTQLSGGTLTGPATIEGPFTWLAGSIADLTFGTTAVLTIGSAAVHDFNASAWTNNGTVNWTDGQIRSGSAGSITNHA